MEHIKYLKTVCSFNSNALQGESRVVVTAIHRSSYYHNTKKIPMQESEIQSGTQLHRLIKKNLRQVWQILVNPYFVLRKNMVYKGRLAVNIRNNKKISLKEDYKDNKSMDY
jgi:hypothetical protein